MTKLLAAIKELDIPLERLRGGVCAVRGSPLSLAVLVLIHASWLVLFSEFIPVNLVATNTNHQCHPNHTDHININTIEAVTANSHRIQEKHNVHEHKQL